MMNACADSVRKYHSISVKHVPASAGQPGSKKKRSKM